MRYWRRLLIVGTIAGVCTAETFVPGRAAGANERPGVVERSRWPLRQQPLPASRRGFVERLRGGSSAPAAPIEINGAVATSADASGPPALAEAKDATKVRGGFVSSLLSNLFHLEPQELPKFLAMSTMMFGIIYIFTMTRDTKDTLIVTNCGAEAITFLKVYGVLPAAALFMVGYNFLSNHVSHRWLFRLTLVPFLAFYGFFAAVMLPNRGRWHHPGGMVAMGDNPLAAVVNLGRFWMFSLYYIISELWGSAGVPLLFWTCANDVTPVSQAKRLYPLLALLGNFAPIASGQTMAYVTKHRDKSLPAEVAFEHSIKVLTGLMLGAGVIILSLYEYVMHLHEKDTAHAQGAPAPAAEAGAGQHKKDKPKMGLIESFRFLGKSKYLGHIGVIVISYGLSMEFTEIIWKAILKLAYPDKSDYMAFLGQYSSIQGACTVAMLLLGNRVIKYLGWEWGALMTPAMMALLSAPFFGYLTLGNIRQSRKRLMIAVYVGMVQNVLSKATKYALFDPTKEMAYIPLEKEYKVKGKAAIDVLGARLGKSGGALAQQGLVLASGNILNGAPALAAMFAVVNVMWISSVMKLGRLFHQKVQDNAVAAAAADEERKRLKATSS